MLGVVPIVAPLTEGSEVRLVTMFWHVVEVGNRKDYPHHLLRILVEVPRMVLAATELTMVPGPLQNSCTYFLPVGGVAFLILWSYRHITYILKLCQSHS